jgi:Icc-related predicted phosphoesterase
MPKCFFATDLHGQIDRYEKLYSAIKNQRPSAVFLGGDLLPRTTFSATQNHLPASDFLADHLAAAFSEVRDTMKDLYPQVFLIPGNDDPRCEVEHILAAEARGIWRYCHGRKFALGDFSIYGYACVPPTPFSLKDWERYDVSRYVPPGCVSPEEGFRSRPVDGGEIKWGTIQKDLAALVGADPLDRAVLLVHTPPYDTPLDRAGLDRRMYEHVEVDVHVGSIALRRLIEERQPMLTLHGHVHEAPRLTGEWQTQIGRTVCINGAHDGRELALVSFDLESPREASRELL